MSDDNLFGEMHVYRRPPRRGNSGVTVTITPRFLDGVRARNKTRRLAGKPMSCEQLLVLWLAGDETVLQYHPAHSDYVTTYRFCLHMWRPQTAEIPVPPLICI